MSSGFPYNIIMCYIDVKTYRQNTHVPRNLLYFQQCNDKVGNQGTGMGFEVHASTSVRSVT